MTTLTRITASLSLVLLVTLGVGCGTHGAATRLSKSEMNALDSHHRNDTLIYAALVERARLSEDIIIGGAVAQIEGAHYEGLLLLSEALDLEARAQYDAFTKHVEASLDPRVTELRQEVERLNHKLKNEADPAKKAAFERDREHAKAVVGDLSASAYYAVIEFQEELQKTRGQVFDAKKMKLAKETNGRLEILKGDASSAADVAGLLQAELDALSSISKSHAAIDQYLNRPNWVALILHGGLGEIGIDISLDKLDEIAKKGSGELSSALTTYVAAGSREGRKAFGVAFGNIGKSIAKEAKSELSGIAKSKGRDLLMSLKNSILNR